MSQVPSVHVPSAGPASQPEDTAVPMRGCSPLAGLSLPFPTGPTDGSRARGLQAVNSKSKASDPTGADSGLLDFECLQFAGLRLAGG